MQDLLQDFFSLPSEQQKRLETESRDRLYRLLQEQIYSFSRVQLGLFLKQVESRRSRDQSSDSEEAETISETKQYQITALTRRITELREAIERAEKSLSESQPEVETTRLLNQIQKNQRDIRLFQQLLQQLS